MSDVREWHVWPRRAKVVVQSRAGTYCYEKHVEDEYGRTLVLVFGGGANHRFFYYPEAMVRLVDEREVVMMRAASRRDVVITPKGTGRLMYWSMTGSRCKVQMGTGAVHAFDKAAVNLSTTVTNVTEIVQEST